MSPNKPIATRIFRKRRRYFSVSMCIFFFFGATHNCRTSMWPNPPFDGQPPPIVTPGARGTPYGARMVCVHPLPFRRRGGCNNHSVHDCDGRVAAAYGAPGARPNEHRSVSRFLGIPRHARVGRLTDGWRAGGRADGRTERWPNRTENASLLPRHRSAARVSCAAKIQRQERSANGQSGFRELIHGKKNRNTSTSV